MEAVRLERDYTSSVKVLLEQSVQIGDKFFLIMVYTDYRDIFLAIPDHCAITYSGVKEKSINRLRETGAIPKEYIEPLVEYVDKEILKLKFK